MRYIIQIYLLTYLTISILLTGNVVENTASLMCGKQRVVVSYNNIIILILWTMFMMLSSIIMVKYCENSLGSSDECRTTTPSGYRPSQPNLDRGESTNRLLASTSAIVI